MALLRCVEVAGRGSAGVRATRAWTQTLTAAPYRTTRMEWMTQSGVQGRAMAMAIAARPTAHVVSG